MGISSAVALAVACGGSTSDSTPPATDGGATNDDSSTTDGGLTGDSGETFDSGDSAVTHSDGGATGTIACGMGVTCNAATQVCCATAGMGGGGGGDAGGATASCVAIGACNTGLSVSCEGTDNCSGGDVCCLAEGSAGASSTCEASCGQGSIQLCDMDTDCTAPATCRMSAMFGGLGVCRAAMGDGGFPHDGGGFPHDGGGMPGDAAAD